MTYEVVISKQADVDLRDIYKYIAFEISSMDNAIRQLDRLEKGINGLENFLRNIGYTTKNLGMAKECG